MSIFVQFYFWILSSVPLIYLSISLIYYTDYDESKSVSHSCPILGNPKDCSLPGPSVHRILQARILEWVATPFSRGSSQPRDWTQVSYIAGRFFTVWTTREAILITITDSDSSIQIVSEFRIWNFPVHFTKPTKTLIPHNTQHKFKILSTMNVEGLQTKLANHIFKNQYFTIKYDVN